MTAISCCNLSLSSPACVIRNRTQNSLSGATSNSSNGPSGKSKSQQKAVASNNSIKGQVAGKRVGMMTMSKSGIKRTLGSGVRGIVLGSGAVRRGSRQQEQQDQQHRLSTSLLSSSVSRMETQESIDRSEEGEHSIGEELASPFLVNHQPPEGLEANDSVVSALTFA